MNPLHRIAVAAGIGLALLVPGVAHAHVPTVVPGAACAHVGDKGVHGSDHYVCEQHKGDQCPVWHHVPQPGASTTWTHAPCPCESDSPSPSHTPTAAPTPSHAPTPTASPSGTAVIVTTPSKSAAGGAPVPSTTPVADTGTLPVTGSRLIPVITFGGVLIALGLLGLLAARSRNRHTV